LKHLRVFLILIALLLAALGATIFTASAGAPVGRDALTPRAYLPLVARSGPTPNPGTWVTVLEEGFEDAPGPRWQFRDDSSADPKVYQWGRRDCQPSTGSYSAWAVGGGADGETLACGSVYPDNVATTMIYGPFSLADAKMAHMHFELRYDQISSGDEFCWFAADAPVLADATVAGGLCLNAQPTGWTTLDLDLGDLVLSDPVVSVLGRPQAWVAFRFTSDTAGHASPGPFVDDVLIRKCLDTLCSPLSAAAPEPGRARAVGMLPAGH
jgi:hypothetical protein